LGSYVVENSRTFDAESLVVFLLAAEELLYQEPNSTFAFVDADCAYFWIPSLGGLSNLELFADLS